MPFLRFSRDKRGYEHFHLVQPSSRRGKSRSRILYWFRTPPNVKVGREPFDDAIRRALEAQNPDVAFDWQKLLETPIPPAEAERWRDRRRAERAAKLAAADEARETGAEVDEVEREEPATEDLPVAAPPAVEAAELTSTVGAVPPAAEAREPSTPARRRRRGRRGRRGRRSAEAIQLPASGSGQSTSAEKAGEFTEPRESSERLRTFEPPEPEKQGRDV